MCSCHRFHSNRCALSPRRGHSLSVISDMTGKADVCSCRAANLGDDSAVLARFRRVRCVLSPKFVGGGVNARVSRTQGAAGVGA
ncbi:hypothetical protein ACFPRL_13875 [Pseudoclavibacter helvolus]